MQSYDKYFKEQMGDRVSVIGRVNKVQHNTNKKAKKVQVYYEVKASIDYHRGSLHFNIQ